MAESFFRNGWTRAHLGTSKHGTSFSEFYLDFEHRGGSRLYFHTMEDQQVFDRVSCGDRQWKGGPWVRDFDQGHLGRWLGYPDVAVRAFMFGTQDMGVRLGDLCFTCSHKDIREVLDSLWAMYGGKRGISGYYMQLSPLGLAKGSKRPAVRGAFSEAGFLRFRDRDVPEYMNTVYPYPPTCREKNPSLYPSLEV